MGNFRIKNGSFVEVLAIVIFFLWWILTDKTVLPTVLTECTDMLISMLVVLILVLSTSGMVSGLLSKEKMLKLGKISLEFYLLHNLVIKYGMIAAKYFSLDHGIAVLSLTVLFFVMSLYGAYLIHNLAEWLLLIIRKKKQTLS